MRRKRLNYWDTGNKALIAVLAKVLWTLKRKKKEKKDRTKGERERKEEEKKEKKRIQLWPLTAIVTANIILWDI